MIPCQNVNQTVFTTMVRKWLGESLECTSLNHWNRWNWLARYCTTKWRDFVVRDDASEPDLRICFLAVYLLTQQRLRKSLETF